MEIYKKLTEIQNEMKVPKNLYNKFGGYNYRNAETIFETVKPLLKKHKVSLTVSDEIVLVGDSVYVKAIAVLTDDESDAIITNTAYAREPKSKKGMDESQITGSTSSYARKYALNGLFLLDDTKDADSDEYVMQTTQPLSEKLIAEARDNDVNLDALAKYLKKSADELTEADVKKAIKTKQKAKEQKEKANG